VGSPLQTRVFAWKVSSRCYVLRVAPDRSTRFEGFFSRVPCPPSRSSALDRRPDDNVPPRNFTNPFYPDYHAPITPFSTGVRNAPPCPVICYGLYCVLNSFPPVRFSNSPPRTPPVDVHTVPFPFPSRILVHSRTLNLRWNLVLNFEPVVWKLPQFFGPSWPFPAELERLSFFFVDSSFPTKAAFFQFPSTAATKGPQLILLFFC